MTETTISISSAILHLLAQREHRLLVLTVAVRKALGPFQHVKGNLSELVRSSLTALVAAGMVIESDGVFTLRRRK